MASWTGRVQVADRSLTGSADRTQRSTGVAPALAASAASASWPRRHRSGDDVCANCGHLGARDVPPGSHHVEMAGHDDLLLAERVAGSARRTPMAATRLSRLSVISSAQPSGAARWASAGTSALVTGPLVAARLGRTPCSFFDRRFGGGGLFEVEAALSPKFVYVGFGCLGHRRSAMSSVGMLLSKTATIMVAVGGFGVEHGEDFLGGGGDGVELGGGERVDEQAAYHRHMVGCGLLDGLAARFGGHDEGAAAVAVAALFSQKSPSGHAGDLMGQPTFLPAEGFGQFEQAGPAVGVVAESDENQIVGVGQLGGGGHIGSQAAGESQLHELQSPPCSLFVLVEPPDPVHGSSVGRGIVDLSSML